MNCLTGKIASFNVYENLTLVSIQVGGVLMTSIIIETPNTCRYLVEGKPIKVLFKETEVVIGKGDISGISLQNRLECELVHINKGVLLSELTLITQNITIYSIITTNAVNQLGLEVGEIVLAMIKTNEIMLSE